MPYHKEKSSLSPFMFCIWFSSSLIKKHLSLQPTKRVIIMTTQNQSKLKQGKKLKPIIKYKPQFISRSLMLGKNKILICCSLYKEKQWRQRCWPFTTLHSRTLCKQKNEGGEEEKKKRKAASSVSSIFTQLRATINHNLIWFPSHIINVQAKLSGNKIKSKYNSPLF